MSAVARWPNFHDHRFCRQRLYILHRNPSLYDAEIFIDHLDVKAVAAESIKGLLAGVRHPDIDLDPSRAVYLKCVPREPTRRIQRGRVFLRDPKCVKVRDQSPEP